MKWLTSAPDVLNVGAGLAITDHHSRGQPSVFLRRRGDRSITDQQTSFVRQFAVRHRIRHDMLLAQCQRPTARCRQFVGNGSAVHTWSSTGLERGGARYGPAVFLVDARVDECINPRHSFRSLLQEPTLNRSLGYRNSVFPAASNRSVDSAIANGGWFVCLHSTHVRWGDDIGKQ